MEPNGINLDKNLILVIINLQFFRHNFHFGSKILNIIFPRWVTTMNGAKKMKEYIPKDSKFKVKVLWIKVLKAKYFNLDSIIFTLYGTNQNNCFVELGYIRLRSKFINSSFGDKYLSFHGDFTKEKKLKQCENHQNVDYLWCSL